MKYHDNEVYIDNQGGCSFWKNGSSYGKFVIKDSCVSDGQDPEGYLAKGKTFEMDSDGKLVFKAGRHKTSAVATWWKNRIKWNYNTFDKDPDELNFAMLGDLTLNLTGGDFGSDKVTVVLTNVAFAQGNNGRNNWWFGGTDYRSRGDGTARCYINVSGSMYCFTANRTDTTGGDVYRIYFTYSKLNTANAAWMSKNIVAETRLKNLMLPASHDAGMSELHHINFVAGFDKKAVQTQDASIYEQLLYGARYFDIRVDYDHNELVTYHRSMTMGMAMGANGQSLQDVFDQARRFLSEYPTETLIIKISHIRDFGGHDPADTITKLMSFLPAYQKCFYTSDTAVSLHELPYKRLQGRLLLVCDFDGIDQKVNPAAGIFKYVDVGSGVCSVKNNQLNVYDVYSNTNDYEKMKNDQLGKWKENANDKENKLFLLSWTLTQSTGSIRDGAKLANSQLNDVLKEQINTNKWPLPNMVYIDFIDDKIFNEVIAYNKE